MSCKEASLFNFAYVFAGAGYFAYDESPVLGLRSSAWNGNEWFRQILQILDSTISGETELLCFFAEDSSKYPMWCPYKGRGAATIEARLGYLWDTSKTAWGYMEKQKARGGNGVLIGISNGCIVAAELACWFPGIVSGLGFLSGSPSGEHLRRWKEGAAQKPKHCVFSIGSQERYFGGPSGLQKIAESLNADVVVKFEGDHCQESTSVLQHVITRLIEVSSLLQQ